MDCDKPRLLISEPIPSLTNVNDLGFDRSSGTKLWLKRVMQGSIEQAEYDMIAFYSKLQILLEMT